MPETNRKHAGFRATCPPRAGPVFSIVSRVRGRKYRKTCAVAPRHASGRVVQACQRKRERRTGDGRVCLGPGPGNLAAAEEVRFELTGPLRAHRFSRPAHSATLPLLRQDATSVAAPAI